MKNLNYLLIFILSFLSPIGNTGSAFQFSLEELDTLNRGEIVLRENKIKGAPWPEYQLFALRDFSPLTGIAIFAAYDDQKNYVPRVLKSEVLGDEGNGKITVSYILDNPWPISNSHYTNTHELQKLSANHYKVSWNQVKSDSTIESRGSNEFLKWDSKTLMSYRSFVHPKSMFASLVKSKAKSDLNHVIGEILHHIESLSKFNPKKTGIYKKKILDSLSGKKVY